MRYRNAREALPPELLKEVQKYARGETLYIPREDNARAAWGALSGIRAEMLDRNCYIARRYREGCSVDNLTEEFRLSESSIRKIIYAYAGVV